MDIYIYIDIDVDIDVDVDYRFVAMDYTHSYTQKHGTA